MKYVVVALILGSFCGSAFASDMSFLKNYDAKIKALNSYSVTYLEAGQKPAGKVDSSGGADTLRVKLIAAKKKS
jgi:hypothetical protein